MLLWAMIGNSQGYLTEMAALAAIAAIGYLFGQRTRKSVDAPADNQLHQELSRATLIAKELQQIAGCIRKDVASHQSNITQFSDRVGTLQSQAGDDGWQTLSSEAESLLAPTMKLATDLSLAYDQLRRQSLLLMNFAGSRTDPLTGIHNRRAMEEQLEVLLSLHEQNDIRFSLALFSLEGCSAEKNQGTDELSCEFTALLESCARDTDVVTRYSSEEYVVLMPQTSLAGAMIFSDRLLRHVDKIENCVVAGGIVEVQTEDDSEKLLSRADSALYSARANGYNCLYQHNGKNLREHEVENAPETHDKSVDEMGTEEEAVAAPTS